MADNLLWYLLRNPRRCPIMVKVNVGQHIVYLNASRIDSIEMDQRYSEEVKKAAIEYATQELNAIAFKKRSEDLSAVSANLSIFGGYENDQKTFDEYYSKYLREHSELVSILKIKMFDGTVYESTDSIESILSQITGETREQELNVNLKHN